MPPGSNEMSLRSSASSVRTESLVLSAMSRKLDAATFAQPLHPLAEILLWIQRICHVRTRHPGCQTRVSRVRRSRAAAARRPQKDRSPPRRRRRRAPPARALSAVTPPTASTGTGVARDGVGERGQPGRRVPRLGRCREDRSEDQIVDGITRGRANRVLDAVHGPPNQKARRRRCARARAAGYESLLR